jgi:hypothetical protein
MDVMDATEERIRLAVLLRSAAGCTARDWVMAEEEGRSVIHLSGLVRLVEAAGFTLADWRRLFEVSRRRAAELLLAGARLLSIPTDWHGLAWLGDIAS